MRTFEEYAEDRLIDEFIEILEQGTILGPTGEPYGAPAPAGPTPSIIVPPSYPTKQPAPADPTRNDLVDKEIQTTMKNIGQRVDRIFNLIKRSIKGGTAKYVPPGTVGAAQTMQQRYQPPSDVAGAMSRMDVGQGQSMGSVARRLAAHHDLLANNEELGQIVEKLNFIEQANLPPQQLSGTQVFAKLKQDILREIQGLVAKVKRMAFAWSEKDKRRRHGQELAGEREQQRQRDVRVPWAKS